MPLIKPCTISQRTIVVMGEISKVLITSGVHAQDGLDVYAVGAIAMLAAGGINHEDRVKWFEQASREFDAQFKDQVDEANKETSDV